MSADVTVEWGDCSCAEGACSSLKSSAGWRTFRGHLQCGDPSWQFSLHHSEPPFSSHSIRPSKSSQCSCRPLKTLGAGSVIAQEGRGGWWVSLPVACRIPPPPGQIGWLRQNPPEPPHAGHIFILIVQSLYPKTNTVPLPHVIQAMIRSFVAARSSRSKAS